MNLDLSAFNPEQLAQLKTALDSLTSTDGRSPIVERQLNDLRPLPTATDPRPTFFFSADSPRNVGDLNKTSLYPRLMWTPDGVEVKCLDEKHQARLEKSGHMLVAPDTAVLPTSADLMRTALSALSPEDRKVVLQSAQAARLAKVQEMAAELTEGELDALMAEMEPAKRGPGRPRNVEVAS